MSWCRTAIWHAPFRAARNAETRRNALSTTGVVHFHGYAEQKEHRVNVREESETRKPTALLCVSQSEGSQLSEYGLHGGEETRVLVRSVLPFVERRIVGGVTVILHLSASH
jgi:hypothetical protein